MRNSIRGECCTLFVVLLLPCIFFLVDKSEKSTLPILPIKSAPMPTELGVLKWNKLTWHAKDRSACVTSYQWTNDTSDLRCSISRDNRTCGGIPMSGCALPESGVFLPAQPSDPKPSRLWNTRNASLPLCAEEDDATVGSYLLDTKTFNDSNVWAPFACSLVPLDLESVARVAGPVIFLGDSHGRNSYTAFVAGLRQQHYYLETHDDQFKELQGVLVYKVQRVRGILSDYRGQTWVLNHSVDTLKREFGCDALADLCIQVLFFWAPRFDEQSALVPLLKALRPSLMVVSPGNSYEKAEAFPTHYANKLAELLVASPRLSITFNAWSWAHPQGPARAAAIRSWRKTLLPTSSSSASSSSSSSSSASSTSAATSSSSSSNRVHLLDFMNFSAYGGIQGRNTWHFTCAGRHSAAGQLHGVEAFENCSDVVDSSMNRIALTFALS